MPSLVLESFLFVCDCTFLIRLALPLRVTNLMFILVNKDHVVENLAKFIITILILKF